jgi:hypothetical protein
MDSRLKLLSHSTIQLIQSCPRKAQLTKLWPEYIREPSVDTAFGSMYGEGVQQILIGTPIAKAILLAALKWDVAIDDSKKDKSFWTCLQALLDFYNFSSDDLVSEYEVVLYNGKPTNELGFCIDLGNGYYYRGYMDLVLRHRVTGRIVVVDVKTTGMNYSDGSKYRHSDQGISYSVVLDFIAPGINSYDVIYAEYLTGVKRMEMHAFTIDCLERANWLRNLVLTTQIMELYNSYEDWPTHGGSSCSAYGRQCKMFDYCKMRTSSLITDKVIIDALEWEAANAKLYNPDREVNYDIRVTLQQLIDNQMGLM